MRLTPGVGARDRVRVAAATTGARVQAKDSTELLAEIWLWAVAARAVVGCGERRLQGMHRIEWVGGSAARGFNVRAGATR